MHSFFCELGNAADGIISLERRESDHLFKTLRARPGDEAELLDGRGGRALARVLPGKTLEVTAFSRAAEPPRKLILCTAVPRRTKFDVLLKQAAELGVWEIRLIGCERSVAQPEGSERWQVLLQEGCKQSGNLFLPRIVAPVGLATELARLRAAGVAACYGAVERRNAAAVTGDAGNSGDLAWLVGPEGGFTAGEEELMRSAGVGSLNLGPYVLRLETAAVCGLAVLRQWMMEAEQ